MFRVKTGMFLIILLGTACDWFQLPNNPNVDYTIAEVEEVIVLESYPFPNPWTIEVRGTMPDRSWVFDHFELYKEDFHLSITPVCKQTSGYDGIPDDAPFRRELNFYPDKRGVWQVVVKGQKNTIEVLVEAY